jgi:hypothetical protein
VLESLDHPDRQGFAATHDGPQGEGVVERRLLDEKLEQGRNAVENGDLRATNRFRQVSAITVTVGFGDDQSSARQQDREQFTSSCIESDRSL